MGSNFYTRVAAIRWRVRVIRQGRERGRKNPPVYIYTTIVTRSSYKFTSDCQGAVYLIVGALLDQTNLTGAIIILALFVSIMTGLSSTPKASVTL